MSAYVIMIREELTDDVEMQTYASMARAARGNSPPKPLVFYGAQEALEGPAADGVVVLEFEDMDAARSWYGSPAYQAARAHRLRGARYRVLLADGMTPGT